MANCLQLYQMLEIILRIFQRIRSIAPDFIQQLFPREQSVFQAAPQNDSGILQFRITE